MPRKGIDVAHNEKLFVRRCRFFPSFILLVVVVVKRWKWMLLNWIEESGAIWSPNKITHANIQFNPISSTTKNGISMCRNGFSWAKNFLLTPNDNNECIRSNNNKNPFETTKRCLLMSFINMCSFFFFFVSLYIFCDKQKICFTQNTNVRHLMLIIADVKIYLAETKCWNARKLMCSFSNIILFSLKKSNVFNWMCFFCWCWYCSCMANMR